MVKSPTMVDQKTCNESLHQILEKRQFCGCEICNHRVSMNSSTMEENKSCAKMWLSLRDAVSSETSEKRRQCLESLSPQARRDQALLFQPISVCIQEYICDKQSKLVKLIRLGYETPQSALSVVTELLDMYEKFMDIVADISEFTEREIVPSVNFKDSWISWCKGIFQSVIYSEPVLHQALPEINAQLKKIDERAEDSLIIRQKFNEFCEEMVDSSNSENFPLYVLINECLKEDPVEVDRFKKFCRSLPLHQNVANPSQSGSMMRGDMYSPYVPYSFRDPQVKSGILHQSSVVQLPVLTRDCGVGANAFTDVQLGPFSFPAANGRTFEYVVATTLSQDFANFLRHTGTVEDIHPPSISSDDSPISLSSDDEVQVFTKPSDYAKNSAELFLTDELTGPPVDETTSFPVFNHAEIMSKFYTKAGEIGSENTNEETISDENLYLPNLLKPSSMSPQNDDMFRVDTTVTCRPSFPSPFSHQFGGFPTLVPPPFMVPVLQPQDIGDPSTPMNLFPSLASESQSAPDSVSDLSNHSNTPVLESYTVAPSSVAVNTSVDNNFSSTPPTMKANTNFIPNASNVPQTVTTTTVQQRKKLVAHGRLGRQNQPKSDEKVTFKPQNQGKVSEQNKSPFVPKVVNSTDSGPDENVGERQHSISVQTEGDEYVVTSASQTELVATEQTSQEGPEMSHKGENTSEETSQENSPHAHSPSCSHASKNGHCGHSPPHDQKSECPQRNECKSSEGTGATKYCDCCYCEFFGSGSPAVAPVSKNYPEMRERLRLKLKKNKSCKKEVPRPSKATEAPQQRLKSDLHQLDDRSLEEILNFIEGEAHRIAQPYLKREKQRKARQKNVRENDRKKREKQNSPVPKAESTLVESLKNEKLSDVKRKKDRPSDAAGEGDSGQDLTQQSVKKNGDTSANALKISSEKNGESSPKLPPKSSSREDTPTASKAECERIVREYKKNFLAMAKQQSRVTAGGERVKHAERSEGRVNNGAGGGADETFDRKGDKKSTSKSLDDKPVDTVFLPQEDPVEMDEVEKEIDSFKRFCLDSTRKLREKKITVNWKDFTFKTNKKNQF